MLTPALIWPGLDASAANLARRGRARFSRAVKRGIQARDSLALAASALGIEAPAAGPLARLADGLGDEGRFWFRAAPVTLMPDRDRLLLLPLDAAAALAAEEADALAAAARAYFGDELILERGASGHWYAALEVVREATSESLAAVAGTQLDVSAIARGNDAVALRRFLNELQMLWHSHPVNVARRRAGRPEANALWLWGGGYRPEHAILGKPTTIRASAPELEGLAIHYGLPFAPLAEPAGETAGDCVVIEAGEEAAGRVWLDALMERRPQFRVYTAGVEWLIPARSGLSALFG